MKVKYWYSEIIEDGAVVKVKCSIISDRKSKSEKWEVSECGKWGISDQYWKWEWHTDILKLWKWKVGN